MTEEEFIQKLKADGHNDKAIESAKAVYRKCKRVFYDITTRYDDFFGKVTIFND